MSDNPDFSWEIIAQSMGSLDELIPVTDHKQWLMDNVDPSEILGYLKYEFGELPKLDPNIIEEERRKTGFSQIYNDESRDKLKNLEWSDVADLPALQQSAPMSEQESRVGIILRKIRDGSFGAHDTYGWGMRAYGTTPHETLSKIYYQLTGKIPYSSSGDVA